MTRSGRTVGRFDNTVALITGGASGLGLATTKRYVADGGRAVIGDIDVDGLQLLSDELGDSVLTIHCDVTNEMNQKELAHLAIERFGRLDHAAACAGIAGASALLNTDAEEWRRIVDIDLTGVFLTIKHAGRLMGPGSSIVTIASVNGKLAAPGVGPYNSAKAGVIMLTATAAAELGHRGVRANSICPGIIKTPISSTAFDVLPSLLEDYMDNTPLGRHGEPEEVAALICWLFSDESGYITGEAIGIDGGTHLQRFPRVAVHAGFNFDPDDK